MSKITEFARGQECQIRIPGMCCRDNATTVWCHGNGSAAGKGIGMKSHDALGAIGCYVCHGVVDGSIPRTNGLTRDDVRLAFWEGHARSLRMLIEANLVLEK